MKKFSGILFLLLVFLTPFLSSQSLFSQDKTKKPYPEIKVDIIVTPHTLSPGEKGRISATFHFPEGFHQSKSPEFFYIAPATQEDTLFYSLGKVHYPAAKSEGNSENYYGKTTLYADIVIHKNADKGYNPHLKTGYQICSDSGTCFFPEEKEIPLPLFLAGTSTAAVSLLLLLKFILFAFIGGLLLNVMPCVLPVLSLRALNLVNQRKNDKKSILLSALLYGAGVLFSMLTLAIIVILLKITGQMAGWGFQFQNPLFVSILMVTIFIFTLSLFNVYLINPPGMTGMVKAASQKGYIGSFFNGIFAVLLATPCTAPFLGAALGFAFSQSPLFILFSFAAIGAGFALPFVLLGIWPKWIQAIPKPGPWMDTFKELMGFLLLGTVLYLFTTLRLEISSDSQMNVIFYLLLTAFIAWLYGKFTHPAAKHRHSVIAFILALILLAASGRYLLDFSKDNSNSVVQEKQQESRAGWEPFSPALLQKYQNKKRGVFIAFSAKWCTVCKINDKTIFDTKRGSSFFSTRNIALLYGDYTKNDPLIGEWIRKFGKAGVPVYAYYPPGSAKYILFPEILSWGILEDKIDSTVKKLDNDNFLNQP